MREARALIEEIQARQPRPQWLNFTKGGKGWEIGEAIMDGGENRATKGAGTIKGVVIEA